MANAQRKIPDRTSAESHTSELSPKLSEQGFTEFLAGIEARLRSLDGDQCLAREALDELFLTLHGYRLRLRDSEWRGVVTWCRSHPLFALVQRDPITSRTFRKPRGYAGDACTMDFIYGIEENWPPPTTEPIGRLVFDHLIGGPACRGVRSRRALIASTIDRLAERGAKPHILSIAAGHLREANLSTAVRRQRTGRFVALDTDAQSLAEVRACYGKFGIETATASFRDVLADNPAYSGQFDLVYSTGLFDYLTQRSGRRLLRAMHSALRPGGSLLVANFLPGVRDAGYMEAFMDWKLVYRSRQDMVDLTGDFDEAEIRGLALWSDPARSSLFLRVTRS